MKKTSSTVPAAAGSNGSQSKNGNTSSQDAFDNTEYAKKMRKDLSNKDIFTGDGDLNHAYFLTKRGQYWSEQHQKCLQRGIELFGVGEWKDINFYEFAEQANVVELELRTCILLGINELNEYQGQKISIAQQEEIRQNNLATAKKENRLRDNIYMKLSVQ